MRDPWRYQCPEGHVSLRIRVYSTYYCYSCEKTYDGDPIDAKLEREVSPIKH